MRLCSGRERSGMVFCAVARGGNGDSGVSFAVDGASKVSAPLSTSETARMDERETGGSRLCGCLSTMGLARRKICGPAPQPLPPGRPYFLRPCAHPWMPELGGVRRATEDPSVPTALIMWSTTNSVAITTIPAAVGRD